MQTLEKRRLRTSYVGLALGRCCRVSVFAREKGTTPLAGCPKSFWPALTLGAGLSHARRED